MTAAPLAVYGLKSCDSCRKARRWLAEQGMKHDFFDLREDGLDAATLRGWAENAGWETLLNRRSTSWRALPEARREGLDFAKALALMLEMPTLIKRPVLVLPGAVYAGFDETARNACHALMQGDRP